jgi:hypothetical protein
MDPELLKEFAALDPNVLSAIEEAQKCVALYEQTLIAMGLGMQQTISQSVDNSQLVYTNPERTQGLYADVSEHPWGN